MNLFTELENSISATMDWKTLLNFSIKCLSIFDKQQHDNYFKK